MQLQLTTLLTLLAATGSTLALALPAAAPNPKPAPSYRLISALPLATAKPATPPFATARPATPANVVPATKPKTPKRQVQSPVCRMLFYPEVLCCKVGGLSFIGEECEKPDPVPQSIAAFEAACNSAVTGKFPMCCGTHNPTPVICAPPA